MAFQWLGFNFCNWTRNNLKYNTIHLKISNVVSNFTENSGCFQFFNWASFHVRTWWMQFQFATGYTHEEANLSWTRKAFQFSAFEIRSYRFSIFSVSLLSVTFFMPVWRRPDLFQLSEWAFQNQKEGKSRP